MAEDFGRHGSADPTIQEHDQRAIPCSCRDCDALDHSP